MSALRPTPQNMRARPLASWLARRVMTRNAKIMLKSAPASAPAATPASRAARLHHGGEGRHRAHQHHALEAEVHDAGALAR